MLCLNISYLSADRLAGGRVGVFDPFDMLLTLYYIKTVFTDWDFSKLARSQLDSQCSFCFFKAIAETTSHPELNARNVKLLPYAT
jgi:hypothetical protein